MPKVDINSITEQAAAGKFHPVYFLHGDESFLTRQAVEAITDKAVDRATADFNFERFHGPEIDPGGVLNSLATPPMMAARRVVLVRDFDRAATQAKELLAGYAARPNLSSVLVLACAERVKIDARRNSPKWAATLQEHAATACFWPLREPELIRWITGAARLQGKSLSATVAHDLYARSGDDLARLADEVDKLCLFVGGCDEITGEDVRRMTGIEIGGTVFDWVDALAAGKTLKAGYVAGCLASRGESAVGAIAAAAGHFTRVARICRLREAGLSDERIKKELGLGYWREDSLRELFAQARRYSPVQLERAFELLLETDIGLKSSSLPDRLLLEALAFRFGAAVPK